MELLEEQALLSGISSREKDTAGHSYHQGEGSHTQEHRAERWQERILDEVP